MTIIPNRTVYCPYTDRELPESKSSSEHIIPLSLGGVNGFEIPVDATFNSILGSEIDGKLATDFLWGYVGLNTMHAGTAVRSLGRPSARQATARTAALRRLTSATRAVCACRMYMIASLRKAVVRFK